MVYLADTNLLLRIVDTVSPQSPVAVQAIARLLARGDDVVLTPQNLVEFWSVATRPAAANGLGLETSSVKAITGRLRQDFRLLVEEPALFTNWLDLVTTYDVKGKQVHDARLVAAMQTHAVTHLLTFNVDDFKRYSELISAVHPDTI